METRQIFFSYVGNDKKSKELFASFLNGILISVRCVSFIKFFLTFNLTNCLRRAQTKIGESRRNPTLVARFAGRNTLTFNFYRSLYCVRKNESIFLLSNDLKANRNYTSMLGKSTHLAVIPQQSTQNTANLPLQTYEKKICRVSIPVHIYNSLIRV